MPLIPGSESDELRPDLRCISSAVSISLIQKFLLLLVIIFFACGLNSLLPYFLENLTLSGLLLLYLGNSACRTFLIILGSSYPPSAALPSSEKSLTYPIYTVLVPVFKEAPIIPQLLANLRQLDYPKDKLDIKMIVEADDVDTIRALQQNEHDFEIITVPFSSPQTKPKACNYALKFSKGEFIAIFDAEDRPAPLQLKQAVAIFRHNPEVDYLQAMLNYYNANRNILTKCFCLEYSMTFDMILKGLEKCDFPLMLGGSSNHFRLKTLTDIGAWDPFNVTEDAEISIRMYKMGLKGATMGSLTLEEAPFGLINWIKQRSRWIKGFMQTYIVHIRSSFKVQPLVKKVKLIAILHFFVLGPILVYLLLPFTVINFLKLPYWFRDTAIVSAVIWILGNFYASIRAIRIHRWHGLGWFNAICFNFYFILHTIAAYRALIQLFLRPFYWDKTLHGSHKKT